MLCCSLIVMSFMKWPSVASKCSQLFYLFIFFKRKKRAGIRGFCWGAAQVPSRGWRDLHKRCRGFQLRGREWVTLKVHTQRRQTPVEEVWVGSHCGRADCRLPFFFFFFPELLDQTTALLLLNLTIPTLQLHPVCVFCAFSTRTLLLQLFCRALACNW